jgi:hypothetical protein
MQIVKIENEYRFFKGSGAELVFKPNDTIVVDPLKKTYMLSNTNAYSFTIVDNNNDRLVNVLINKDTHKVMHLLTNEMGLPIALYEVYFDNDETSGFFHNATFELK